MQIGFVKNTTSYDITQQQQLYRNQKILCGKTSRLVQYRLSQTISFLYAYNIYRRKTFKSAQTGLLSISNNNMVLPHPLSMPMFQHTTLKNWEQGLHGNEAKPTTCMYGTNMYMHMYMYNILNTHFQMGIYKEH